MQTQSSTLSFIFLLSRSSWCGSTYLNLLLRVSCVFCRYLCVSLLIWRPDTKIYLTNLCQCDNKIWLFILFFPQRNKRYIFILTLVFLVVFTSSSEDGMIVFSLSLTLPIGAGFCTTGLADVGAKNRLMSCVHRQLRSDVRTILSTIRKNTSLLTAHLQRLAENTVQNKAKHWTTVLF